MPEPAIGENPATSAIGREGVDGGLTIGPAGAGVAAGSLQPALSHELRLTGGSCGIFKT